MLRALLFDLDGTLVNNDPLHFHAWQSLLASHGLTIDEDFYNARISGRPNAEILTDLLPALSPDAVSRFIEEKESYYRSIATRLAPLPGLSDILTWAAGHGLGLAVVTNAPQYNVRFVLEALDLHGVFHHIVLADDVAAGKPDPAPYRTALQNLGVTAAQALAFEDSPSGIRSAIGAGIPTVGIASTHDSDGLRRLGTALVVRDFADPLLWKLLRSL